MGDIRDEVIFLFLFCSTRLLRPFVIPAAVAIVVSVSSPPRLPVSPFLVYSTSLSGPGGGPRPAPFLHSPDSSVGSSSTPGSRQAHIFIFISINSWLIDLLDGWLGWLINEPSTRKKEERS